MPHTPTPWNIGQYQRELDWYGNEVLVTGIYSKQDGVKVAKVETWLGEEYKAESDANAELIVRAVNSHAALLEALKLTLMNAKAPEATDWSAVVQRLERAIAQAEGGA